jgi:aspartate/methionine/tyrosine aminotransferase
MDKKNNIINSSNGRPFIITDSIQPFNITFTNNMLNKTGGLEYDDTYIRNKEINMIKEFYKKFLNITLSNDTYIIFGLGATQLVQCYYSGIYNIMKKKLYVKESNTNRIYSVYKKLINISNSIKWTKKNSPDILIIISPNNPDGEIFNIKNLTGKYKIIDMVYDVPQFTGKFETVNKDIFELFNKDSSISIVNSFSKFGLPGARFGFMLLRDKQLYDEMNKINKNLLYLGTIGKALSLKVYSIYYNKYDWYLSIYNKLEKRRKIFIKYAEIHNIKILNKTFIIPFIYTNKSSEWWIKNFNIQTRKGEDFNDDNKNSRISLLLRNTEWNKFIKNFTTFLI